MKSLMLVAFIMIFSNAGLCKGARSSVMTIKGFDLKSCNVQGKCVRIQSSGAESGNFSPLIVLKNVKADIEFQGKKRSFVGEIGYYSLSEEQIVLTLADGTDFEINLKDLSENRFN